MLQRSIARAAGTLVPMALTLAGCAGMGPMALDDRECMTRVMYFESNRSSEDGMLAVGTTVMNRLNNRKYPKTVCGVVGQRNQFAPGVLTSPMVPRLAARVAKVADRVLAGERHPQVGSAMFFHTAGYSFPYTNMHYVAVAGGNAFYEKVRTPRPQEQQPAAEPQETMVAEAEPAFSPPPAPSPLMTAPAPRRPPVVTAARPHSIDDLLAQSSPPRQPRVTAAAADFDENGVY